jgi:hypothetical protein
MISCDPAVDTTRPIRGVWTCPATAAAAMIDPI